METYIIKGTHKTPSIHFDAVAGILEIQGRSIHENPYEFYQPLVDFLSKHSVATLPTCEVTINLEYFSTSSSRCLFMILKKLREINGAGASVKVKWLYEEGDDEMRESGEEFHELLEIPFELIQTKRQ
ncbi:MAG: DUF1987 domain-containing protein [bacterium]|nr:DUF1987 domain-containing protein [bacterium]